MKTVDIYLIGKYDYKSHTGCWIYYMTCMGAVLKDSRETNGESSSSRLALIALINAINRIKFPCIINIHTRNSMSFRNIKKSKNKDLLEQILMMLIKAGHEFNIDNNVDNKLIESWEIKYGNKKQKDEDKKYEHKSAKEINKSLEKQAEQVSQDWRAMYSDLMGPSEGAWVPGCGGY